MRPTGSADGLESRRRLAVARVSEGYDAAEVADFLGVTARSVRRWAAAHAGGGGPALAAAAALGRPPKLDTARRAEALS